jgi:hypothetical protein
VSSFAQDRVARVNNTSVIFRVIDGGSLSAALGLYGDDLSRLLHQASRGVTLLWFYAKHVYYSR